MNRKTVKRFLVTVGITAGFVTVTAGQVSAGLVLQQSQRTDPALPLKAIDALIRTPAVAITAIERTWGRYQHRLALGHAALGRPDDALQHAQRAARRLQRAGKDDMRLAAALDTLATCHQDLGQLDAAAQTRRRAVGLLDAGSTAQSRMGRCAREIR